MRSSKPRTVEFQQSFRPPSKPSLSPRLNSQKKSVQNINPTKTILKTSLTKYASNPQLYLKDSPKHFSSNTNFKQSNLAGIKFCESQTQIKKIGKERMIQKPKLIKKKNESIAQLQTKLHTLQNQISSLKTNISSTEQHIQRIRRSRTNSKQSKRSSLGTGSSHRKKTSQSIERDSARRSFFQQKQKPKNTSKPRPSSKGLSSYVTNWKPHEVITSFKAQPTEMAKLQASTNYYIHHRSPAIKQHLITSLSIFNFMKKVPKPLQKQIQSIKVKLPSNSKHPLRKTLVFDLDETLIHCVDMGKPSDIKLPITFLTGQVVDAGINIRNHSRQILTNLSKKFQIVIFTASHSCYANVVIDHLDPKRQIVHHRYFRDNCYKTQQGMYIKDLRVFSNRNLSNVILVDNAPYSYFFQLQNGIPILPFYDSKDDMELRSLQRFLLKQVYPADDVRQVLKKHFKLHRYGQFSDSDKLIRQLYKD